jgi:lipopolysaccharide transport system ATP-binding protein
MSLAIKVENISKKYTISHQQTGIGLATFRDEISGAIKKFSRKIRDEFINQHANETFAKKEEFWALKDITFEVQQGDRVGIIGRNGAGKSTLLKIMSRITEPTLGKFKIKGRIASLLEVGTGFHQELTGRENIYLNGAILGMSRVEIKKKFDEIVAFAEIDKFLDTPVKRYSSGMYVRLAFAVAAHLESEILIVDEVLAVGDVHFQKKCLGKMENVSINEGRTVLFVSHNMEIMASLCNYGLMLQAGEIAFQGAIEDTIRKYNEVIFSRSLSFNNGLKRGGIGGIHLQRIWVEDETGKEVNAINSERMLSLNMEAQVSPVFQGGKSIIAGFGIDNMEGRRLLTCVSNWSNQDIKTAKNKIVIKCLLPNLPLTVGEYLISASISSLTDMLDHLEHCVQISIGKEKDSFFNTRGKEYGFMDLNYRFSFDNSNGISY